MRFGAHVSIAKHLYLAVDRAQAIGCEAFQMFPGNPRGWKTGPFLEEEVAEFKRRRSARKLGPVIIHLPYLVNLAAKTPAVLDSSMASLKDAIAKAVVLEAEFLVMHPGSHGGAGTDAGIARLAAGLQRALQEDLGGARLLLENTAGSGHTLGSNMREIRRVIQAVDNDSRIGLCFDTCHAFAAGYDLATETGWTETMAEINREIGLDRLGVIHVNDSRGELGSRLDRHAPIGRGKIGLAGFERIINEPALADRPFIIETPRKSPKDDIRNLDVLRKLKSAPRG